MHVKVGSVAFLRAAGSGYGIGLDDDGHRVEFLGEWRALASSSLNWTFNDYAVTSTWAKT